MPPNYFIERPLQLLHVWLPLQNEYHGDVVQHTLLLYLLDKVKPRLRRRERVILPILRRLDGPVMTLRHPFDMRGQPGSGGKIENVGHGKFHLQSLMDAGNNGQGFQRIGPQVEKVVVDTDLTDTETFLPNLG